MTFFPLAVENSLAVSQKVRHRTTIWPISSTHRYIKKRIEMYVHTKTCTQMFKRALLIIAKEWKPKGLSTKCGKQNVI